MNVSGEQKCVNQELIKGTADWIGKLNGNLMKSFNILD